MTSVMAVEVAPDLKTCKAFISVLGNKKQRTHDPGPDKAEDISEDNLPKISI